LPALLDWFICLLFCDLRGWLTGIGPGQAYQGDKKSHFESAIRPKMTICDSPNRGNRCNTQILVW
jgi:hypothetical protein